MRKIAVGELLPGMVLAEAVKSPDGIFSLGSGTVLNQSWIDRMAGWEIDYIGIKGISESPENGADIEKICSAVLKAQESQCKQTPHLPLEAFMSEATRAETQLRRIFLSTRCTGRVPVEDLKHLVDRIVFPMLKIPGIFQLLHLPDRADNYLYRHAIDVALFSGLLAYWLNFPENVVKDLVYAGLVHDIGKAKVYFEILSKPGELTPEERELAKIHVAYGYQMLLATRRVPQLVLEAVYQHHERVDGSGYPRRLKGNEIHTYGKIVAIADVYDAIISDRYYKQGISPVEAVELMISEMQGHFDAEMLNIFLNNFRKGLLKARVRLSTGEIGEISGFPNNTNYLPIIAVGESIVDFAATPEVRIKELLI